MSGILKSAIEKTGPKGKFWVCVIGNDEVLAYDAKILEYEGKEVPFEIGLSGTGKKFVKFPREGGFQGKGGGFSRGKSDREIYAQVLGTCMSYAKDQSATFCTFDNVIDFTTKAYKVYSSLILADLKAIEGEAPKQEAPKVPEKTPVSVPQATSTPKAPVDPDKMTVKEKLAKKMWAYLTNLHSDSDESFKALLIEITSFPDKNKETGELTGKTKSCDNWDRLSEGWAKTAYGKLEKMIEEEERKAVANADLGDDVPY